MDKKQKNKLGHFVKGNTLYKLSACGNKPKYTNAEIIERATAYIEHVKSNPHQQKQMLHKDGSIINIPIERPLTIVGLCAYMNITKQTFYKWLSNDNQREEKRAAISDTYTRKEIAQRIKEVIEAEQLNGALLNVYSPQIVSRLQGLADVQHVENTSNRLKIEIIPSKDNDAQTPPEPPQQGNDARAADDITSE